jgi:hypothetical protein
MRHFMALAFERDHAHLALGSATVEGFEFLVAFALDVQFGPLGSTKAQASRRSRT